MQTTVLNNEVEKFFEEYLKGIFPNWEPTSYEYSKWLEDLAEIDFEEGKRAIALWHKTKPKSEKEPCWRNFQACLNKIMREDYQQHKRKMGSSWFYFAVQIANTYQPRKLGSFRLIAVDLGKLQLDQEVKHRCDDEKRIYTWKYRADTAHEQMSDIAQQYCQSINQDGIQWVPALEYNHRELLELKRAAKAYCRQNNLPDVLEYEITLSDVSDVTRETTVVSGGITEDVVW